MCIELHYYCDKANKAQGLENYYYSQKKTLKYFYSINSNVGYRNQLSCHIWEEENLIIIIIVVFVHWRKMLNFSFSSHFRYYLSIDAFEMSKRLKSHNPSTKCSPSTNPFPFADAVLRILVFWSQLFIFVKVYTISQSYILIFNWIWCRNESARARLLYVNVRVRRTAPRMSIHVYEIFFPNILPLLAVGFHSQRCC